MTKTLKRVQFGDFKKFNGCYGEPVYFSVYPESEQGALVTRKNNKPAVYVENIGGDNEKLS